MMFLKVDPPKSDDQYLLIWFDKYVYVTRPGIIYLVHIKYTCVCVYYVHTGVAM